MGDPADIETHGGLIMTKFLKLIRDKRGATAIEYGLIAALIAVAAITAMTSIGSKLGSTFNNVASNLD
jgi:pilus assembly protein Flp/PilA